MKKTIVILLLFITGIGLAQNASTFFPATPGYKWYYKNIPLDSLNNPMTNLTRYRIDSFAVNANYKGLPASIVRIKDNLLSFNQNTPYNDTSWHNFQTTNGWEYLSTAMITDSIPLPGFINFLKGLENWYNVYRYAQAVNSEYIVLTKDTTISIDTISAPIRVKLKVKRLNDETVSTVNGNYISKKFVTTFGLYYRFFILEIPIVERPDTNWIAQNVWVVKKISPSVNVNLSPIGVPFSFSIPGNIYELTNPSIGIQNISSEIPAGFSLKQNYPNPFNPVTNIQFGLSKNEFVSIIVFDILGKEIATLVNEYKQAGTYQVDFKATSLTSGVYFYRMKAGTFTDIKRMTLLK